jgi:hypothetical protein
MKTLATIIIVSASAALICSLESENTKEQQTTGNACDSTRFIQIANGVEEIRKRNRLSEEEFAKAAQEPGTIVLDARGREFYEQLHVAGSVNLPYTHFSAYSLSWVVPTRSTRILIYCRNNFINAPESFPVIPAKPEAFEVRVIDGQEIEVPIEYEPPELPKIAEAGLNLPTFITLHSYGYDNIWELDDIVDPNDSPIQFARDRPKRPNSPEDKQTEQDGTGQPATRPESKSEGSDKPQPEAEGRPR